MENDKKLADVIVTKAFAGICNMQVCVKMGLTDKEILEAANRLNECGTERGWLKVCRGENGDPGECKCEKHDDRIHLFIGC